MKRIVGLVVVVLIIALAGQAFAGAVAPVERKRTVNDAPVLTVINEVIDRVDYGDYTFTAIAGTYYEHHRNDSASGHRGSVYGSGSWTSIWNAGPSMSSDVYNLLNSTGGLNYLSSELLSALRTGSYYSNTFGVGYRSWMSSPNSSTIMSGINSLYPDRDWISDCSVTPGNITRIADRRVTSVTYSDPYYTGNYVTQEKDNDESAITWEVTHNTYGYDKTTTFTQREASLQVNTYTIEAHTVTSPIVLDLDGDGKLGASGGVHRPHDNIGDLGTYRLFDFYGNGFPVLIEWVTKNDGLLCVPHADGTIDGTCLFGTADGFENGYVKLASYDTNDDGAISGQELTGLRIWVDADQNAAPGKGEMFTLQELGITQLNLSHKGFVGSFVRSGRTCTMWDWFPTVLEVEKI